MNLENLIEKVKSYYRTKCVNINLRLVLQTVRAAVMKEGAKK